MTNTVIITRSTKKGQRLELGVSETMGSLWATAWLDGEEIARSLQPYTAQKHNMGAHYTHQLGKVLLTTAEAGKLSDAIRAAYTERRQTIANLLATNIVGYAELSATIADEIRYQAEFSRMMEDGDNDGVQPPQPVTFSSSIVAKKYPRAACYIKAEHYSRASHDRKASAGRQAMEILLHGGSIDEANEILENWLPASAIWD